MNTLGDLYVIGVDPGVTTGLAIASVPYLSIFGSEPGSINGLTTQELQGSENGQVIVICDIAKRLQRDHRDCLPPVIICEDFELRSESMDKDLLSPVRVAAKLNFAISISMAGDAIMITQTAAMAKSTATDERLKAWDMWVTGSAHKRDAVRHLVTFLRRAKKDSGLMQAAWGRSFPHE